MLITDDIEAAKKQGEELWKVTSEAEKKMKETQDEEEKKKADEEAKNSEPEDDEDADDEDFDDEEPDDEKDDAEAEEGVRNKYTYLNLNHPQNEIKACLILRPPKLIHVLFFFSTTNCKDVDLQKRLGFNLIN